MKKFSRASREITVTLICILACSFSVFDIAGGRFFQRLLISAGGGSWPNRLKNATFCQNRDDFDKFVEIGELKFVQIQTRSQPSWGGSL